MQQLLLQPSSCLSYAINILLGRTYFIYTHDIFSRLTYMGEKENPAYWLKKGGVPLPEKAGEKILLCNVEDEFGTYRLTLNMFCKLSSMETVHVQSSHLRALLFFCVTSETSHLLMGVHRVIDGGGKRARNVLHCYALVWE